MHITIVWYNEDMNIQAEQSSVKDQPLITIESNDSLERIDGVRYISLVGGWESIENTFFSAVGDFKLLDPSDDTVSLGFYGAQATTLVEKGL